MPVPSTSALHARSLLRDDVYLSLREAIVDGTFAPGERLRDSELEAWLGVSRTPIREALLRLSRAGLVVAQPGRATIVSPLDDPATLHAQQVASAMHELAARLAVPLVTDEDLDAMELANDRFAAALQADDADAALAADDAFHVVFVERSGNSMLADVLEQTTPLIRRVERVRFESLAARESVDQHHAIVDRTRARDAEGAAVLARENWMTLARTLDT